MIDDGDFDIPSVFMTKEDGDRLLQLAGQHLTLVSASRPMPGKAANTVGWVNQPSRRRIVITADIDAKKDVLAPWTMARALQYSPY